MLYGAQVSVGSEIHTKQINPLNTKRRPLYLKTQSVPRSKHFISVIKTNQFMLYGAQVSVGSEIHTKQINPLKTKRRPL